MKRVTKTAKILKYKVTYPNATPAEIAKKVNCPITTVYTTLSAWRKRNHGIEIVKNLDRVYNTVAVVTSNTSIEDAVNHPAHYKIGGIETIDFIEAKKLNYNLGNVVKYIARADHKGLRKQDLEKAKWYLEREIAKG